MKWNFIQVIVGPSLRDHQVNMECPNCHSQVLTTVKEETGPGAWVFCIVMCCIGYGTNALLTHWLTVGFIYFFSWFIIVTCFLCCLPWCIPAFKIYTHSCPHCKETLGKYKGALSMG